MHQHNPFKLFVLLLKWTQLNPTHQKLINLEPTRPDPTHGSTQPMDNSESNESIADDYFRVTVSAFLSLIDPAHQLVLPLAAFKCDVF